MFFAQPLFSAEKISADTGYVILSNGEKIEGVISGTRGRKVTVYGDRKYSVPFAEIVSIEMKPEKEEMLPVWYFKEDGSDEKIFSGEEYPYREYTSEIRTAKGDLISGTMIPVVVYVDKNGEKQKFIFKTKVKGKPDQTLDDIVSPVRLVVGNTAGEKKLPVLTVVSEKIQPVFVRMDTFNTVAAETDKNKKGIFILRDTAGPIAAAGNDAHRVFTSPWHSLKEGTQKDRDEIARLIRELPDFYTRKQVLYCAAGKTMSCSLVESTRTEKTSLKGAKSFIRYDLWFCRKDQDVWQYVKRVFICRKVCKTDEPERLKPVVLDEKWDIPVPDKEQRIILEYTEPEKQAEKETLQ